MTNMHFGKQLEHEHKGDTHSLPVRGINTYDRNKFYHFWMHETTSDN